MKIGLQPKMMRLEGPLAVLSCATTANGWLMLDGCASQEQWKSRLPPKGQVLPCYPLDYPIDNGHCPGSTFSYGLKHLKTIGPVEDGSKSPNIRDQIAVYL